MNKDLDFIINVLGFDKDKIYQNKSRSIVGKETTLDIYDIKQKVEDDPYATVVVDTQSKNNKIAIAIGSNPKTSFDKKDVDKEDPIRLEPTRRNSLEASKAHYLIQFDITNVDSDDNNDLATKSDKHIKNGILVSIKELENTLKYLKKNDTVFELILAYGVQGRELLETSYFDGQTNKTVLSYFAKIIKENCSLIEQFTLPEEAKTKISPSSKVFNLFPPHASFVNVAGYKHLDKIDNNTLNKYLN